MNRGANGQEERGVDKGALNETRTLVADLAVGVSLPEILLELRCVQKSDWLKGSWDIVGGSMNRPGIDLAKETLSGLLKLNRCSDQDKTVLPGGCQLFKPAPDGQPVVWCLYHGDHGFPPGCDELIVRFFKEQALKSVAGPE